MRLTSRFVFVAILFMCTLKVTLAHEWNVNMFCSALVLLRVEHSNLYGTQIILWNPTISYPDNTLCDPVGILCIKDVIIQTVGCEKVAIDFKVRYGNMWSRYIHVDYHDLKPEEHPNGVLQDAHFDPIFM
ncbi:hypothetical protein EDC96DRAFT_499126 [Choanephora cucurbitarum]|nr:hypothetical protein EDC96DRAFT_499126 [Choanephora cucurbitarum]